MYRSDYDSWFIKEIVTTINNNKITLLCRIMSFPGLHHAVDDRRNRTAATRLTMDSSRRAHLFAKN